MKEKIKKYFFCILQLLIILLLAYREKKIAPPYYVDVTTFISFELFGILLFYTTEKYINFLEKKVIFYLLFIFLLINIFKYMNKEYKYVMMSYSMISTLLSFLIIFIYSIMKRKKFYFIYSIIQLLWFIFFILLNMIGNTEAWTYELNIFHILVVYVGVSFLCFELFKKNDDLYKKEK